MIIEQYIQFKNEFIAVCESNKDKIAITYYKKDGTIEECSYYELEHRVLDIIDKYAQYGIRRGDRVAVLIPLSTNAYIDILALASMGATSVVLDINLHEQELRRILEDADVSCVITVPSLYEEKMKSVDIPVLDSSDSALPICWKEIRNVSDPDYNALAILYSSGTTSTAKGVVIGYEQEIKAMNSLLDIVGTSDIRYLMLFPNSHVSGFTDFLVLLLRGGQLATMEDSSSAQIMRGFQNYRPNTFGMVPKVWEIFKDKIEEGIRSKGTKKSKAIFRLISLAGFIREKTKINVGRFFFKRINRDVFGGNLRQAHFGGGKSNPQVTRFFWNLGFDCYDFYASTEANIPILVTDGKKYMNSNGDIKSNKNVDIRIWNPDCNGIGEIQVKSKLMMRGYFRNPELTKESFIDGYFKTGDYGKIQNNQLYITGRIKESIHLENGEKVSPEDVERAYKQLLNSDIEFSVAGIPVSDNNEQIGIFVVGIAHQYDEVFEKLNAKVAVNYRFKKIFYIDCLPKTSVGKVKRYQLIQIANETDSLETQIEGNLKNDLYEIVRSYSSVSSFDEDSLLVGDMGFDSLRMFELLCKLEEVYGVNFAERMGEIRTYGELRDCIVEYQNNDIIGAQNNKQYPKRKTRFMIQDLKIFLKILRGIYTFNVKGIENIPRSGKYIICSNHTSNLDPFFLLAAMPKSVAPLKEVCTLAAEHTLKHGISKWLFEILGGIPVDRYGNTQPAMRNAVKNLRENRPIIIFPEGARSRDGSLLPFRPGVGELAIQTNTKIIPVVINGGYAIFPRHQKLPNVFCWSKMKKYRLEIIFLEPIIPGEMSAEDISIEIMNRIKEKYEMRTGNDCRN